MVKASTTSKKRKEREEEEERPSKILTPEQKKSAVDELISDLGVPAWELKYCYADIGADGQPLFPQLETVQKEALEFKCLVNGVKNVFVFQASTFGELVQSKTKEFLKILQDGELVLSALPGGYVMIYRPGYEKQAEIIREAMAYGGYNINPQEELVKFSKGLPTSMMLMGLAFGYPEDQIFGIHLKLLGLKNVGLPLNIAEMLIQSEAKRKKSLAGLFSKGLEKAKEIVLS
jgi:hypothetical protein